MGRACCISVCRSGVKVPSHKFPKNPKRCAEWINNLKLEHLRNYTSNNLQKFKVRHKHFLETDYSCSPHHRFLKDTAVPFIKDTDVTVSNLLQQQSQQQNLLQEDRNVEQVQIIELQEQVVEHEIYNEQQEVQDIQIREVEEQNFLQQAMQKHINNEKNKEAIIQDHEYRLKKLEGIVNVLSTSPKRKIRNRPNLQEITRKANLTPKARRLYQTTITLRRDNRRLRRLLKQCKEENNTRKEQKTTLSLSRSNNDRTDSAKVRERFINMILRNNDIPPQIFN